MALDPSEEKPHTIYGRAVLEIETAEEAGISMRGRLSASEGGMADTGVYFDDMLAQEPQAPPSTARRCSAAVQRPVV